MQLRLSKQAFRSKIVYFADQASEKLGKSIYTCSEKEQALFLLHELERFSNCHYWLKVLTIEILHRYTAATWLKTWLGDKLQIIYVDTAEEKRLGRSLVSPDSLKVNDTAKFERGADRIRSGSGQQWNIHRDFAEHGRLCEQVWTWADPLTEMRNGIDPTATIATEKLNLHLGKVATVESDPLPLKTSAVPGMRVRCGLILQAHSE
jgi:hypothetical protein